MPRVIDLRSNRWGLQR